MFAQLLRMLYVPVIVLVSVAALADLYGDKLLRMIQRKPEGDGSSSDATSERKGQTFVPEEAERTLIGRMADKNGFEYSCYRLRDEAGNVRMAYSRIVPTTYAFTCPDCGGMVVGVDARRVWPGTAGPQPSAFRCEKCGRQEDHDFGVPRVEERESAASFIEPMGLQPACPRGGKHAWEVLHTWSEERLPEGVDPCLENLCLLEEIWYERRRCTRCGEEHVEQLDR